MVKVKSYIAETARFSLKVWLTSFFITFLGCGNGYSEKIFEDFLGYWLLLERKNTLEAIEPYIFFGISKDKYIDYSEMSTARLLKPEVSCRNLTCEVKDQGYHSFSFALESENLIRIISSPYLPFDGLRQGETPQYYKLFPEGSILKRKIGYVHPGASAPP